MDDKFYKELKDCLKSYDLVSLKYLISRHEKNNTDNSYWHNIKGNYFNLIKEYYNAKYSYDKAIELNPNESVFYSNRADLLSHMGYASLSDESELFNIACQDYSTAFDVKSHNNMTQLLINWGCVLCALNRENEAGEKFDAASEYFDDTYTNSIWSKIKLIESKQVKFKLYKLYFYCLRLRKKFEYKFDCDRNDILHYTSIGGLVKVLSHDNPQFWLANVAYLDDPNEGNKIFEMFNKYMKNSTKLDCIFGRNDCIKQQIILTRKAYIMSFTLDKENFKMWKAYGANGKGAVMSFNESFFDKDFSFALSSEEPNVTESINKNLLYIVQYIADGCHPEYGKREFNKVCESLDSILEHEYGNDNLADVLCDILDRIAFLYKRIDCSSDKEARIIKYATLPNAKINAAYLENQRSPKLYLPIDIPNDSIDDIHIGVQVEKSEQLAQFLYKTGKVKNVRKSSIEIG